MCESSLLHKFFFAPILGGGEMEKDYSRLKKMIYSMWIGL